ncbi:glycosyltransferase [Gaetbulibacter saemankumensis]|uniref:glycosyltransferase n=1 Tax=Gaetbulibacter saemankumensis TaxID=311208 RepID=UPI0004052F8D|nr:glycosyltransferase [Gaetbulibacter saemankumensis]
MKNRILVAPLNWGLGHATRCIPIINALIANNYNPIIASDGTALDLLRKEFPNLVYTELPSYDVTYAKKGKYFKLKLLKDLPKLLKAIKKEKIVTNEIMDVFHIDGIISDNRLGVYSKHVPTAFITHQLNVLSGITTWFSTKIHEKFIQKFDECWVPDLEGAINLSGKLGHAAHYEIPTKYIGPQSRFEKQDVEIKNRLMVLLSGPEPQRGILEQKLLQQLENYKNGQVVFVKGIMEEKQRIEIKDNISIYNFMTSTLLEQTINESEVIISRSGYTTVMDLAKLNKKAFFIPTPGQTEQEYLAKRLSELKLVPSCDQDNFHLGMLNSIEDFKGLSGFHFNSNFKELFSLFERE